MERTGYNKISRIRLTGFLGFINYDMDLADPVTIITAPNGFGKSTIFYMTRFLLDPSGTAFERIKDIPFKEFRCDLSNGMAVELRREDVSDAQRPNFVYIIYNKNGSVRHKINSKEYGDLILWCIGHKEKEFLEESGCMVKINYRPPSDTFYENYKMSNGTQYAWEDDRWESSESPIQFDLFTRIFNERNERTGKTVKISPDGIELHSKLGQITFNTLSAGEAHDFALFYNLVFNAYNGVVLIDEPERSMHISLQKSFIDRVMEICMINDLQVIIATHSPEIVNRYRDHVRGPK